jgi:sugar (pentulose or hexulose) kinase
VTVALLIDLGASRTKAVLYEKHKSTYLDQIELPSPPFKMDSEGKVEVDGELYWQIFERLVHTLLVRNKKYNVNKIYLCSEMHGFLLANDSGAAQSGYISWRDQRASRDNSISSQTTLSRLRDRYSVEFRQATGMSLKSGLPLVSLASSQAKTREGQERLRFLSLPEWLMVRGGCKNPKVNVTLAAGSGFFDIRTKTWSPELLALAKLPGEAILFSPIADSSNYLGKLEVANHQFTVYGGIGDLQAALHGADIDSLNTAVVNLGTGSQVAVLGGDVNDSPYEIRLSVHNKSIRTISHIPAGRALNVFAKIFDDIAQMTNSPPVFWSTWATLNPAEVLSAKLNCDLSVFDAAWGSNRGHGWIEIREDCNSARDVFCGLAKSWLIQYHQALKLILPPDPIHNIKLAGGLSRRGQFVAPVLQHLCKYPVSLTSLNAEEETIIGLQKIYNEQV